MKTPPIPTYSEGSTQLKEYQKRQAKATKYVCELCGYKTDFKNAMGKHKNLAHGIQSARSAWYQKWKAKRAKEEKKAKMREYTRKWRLERSLTKALKKEAKDPIGMRAYNFNEPWPNATKATEVKFCPSCGFDLGRIDIK